MVKLNTLLQSYLGKHFWLADSTKETTERAFRYFKDLIGDIMIDRVNYNHCEDYKNFIFKSGRSKNTANIYIRALKPVFNWAIKQGMIEVNPVIGLRLFKVTQHSIRVYESWEFQRMFDCCGRDIRWKGIMLAAKAHGLRRGEILNMTQNDIKHGYFHVEPKKETPWSQTWAWEPKDREIRKVPLIPQMQVILDQLNCFYPFLTNERYEKLLDRKDKGLLTNRVRRCPDENFRRVFVQYQRKAFGRQIGDFHSLRKTYITEMLERGVPPHVVKELSGHSDLRTMDNFYCASRESAFEIARIKATEAEQRGHLDLPNSPKTKTA